MSSERFEFQNTNVDLERQINDIKRYIETGDSSYKDGLMVIAVTRLAIKKAHTKRIDVKKFEEEVDLLESAAKKRYIGDKIGELEEYKKSKNVMSKNDGIKLVKLINNKLKKLEGKGIDTSELRERLYNI